uniref:Uncharacterized protein n=1 Tax=Arundo donax TaxID=35708 RepID=A0A0A9DB64_ARUDO
MGMPALDFSSPLKKKAKHNSPNGDDLSEWNKETEKDNFSFSFDFIELGKFNLDAKVGIEEKSMRRFTGKTDPVSSEGNKDTQRGLSAKGTDIHEDNKSTEQTQTQDTCTLKLSHLTRQENVKNGSRVTSNVIATDSSEKIQEHTSVSPARMEQAKVDPVSSDRHGEHSKEAHPTQLPTGNVNSKEPPMVDFSKVHMSRESNDNEQSISSQSRNTITVNPYISRQAVGQLDSQNEVMEESVSFNEGSQSNQSFSGTPRSF